MKIKNTRAGKALSKHSKTIKKIAVIGGIAASPVLSALATVKAVRAVDAKKEELGVDKLSPKETVKTVWHYYIATAATTGLTITGAVDIDRKNMAENAALTALATAAEQTVDDFKEKMKATIGEAKTEAIVDTVNADKAEAVIAENVINYIPDSSDVVLMFEPITGTLLYDTTNNFEKACIKATNVMQRDDRVSLDELFDFLDDTAHWVTERGAIADHIGWNTRFARTIEVKDWVKADVTSNNKPYLIIRFAETPITTFMER